jgi:divalent metal cation (Fe/Co/Zn/Cd) transporter
MAKKRKQKFPFPKLGNDLESAKREYERLQSLSEEELHEEMYKAKRAEVVLKKKKKDCDDLNKLKEELKTFIDAHMPDELLKEIERIARDKKQTLKEIKDMEQIKDTVLDLKIKNGEHNNDIACQTQKQKAILEIVRKRENI